MKKQHEEIQLEKLLKNLAEEARPDKKFGQMLQHKLKEKFAEAHGSNSTSFFMRLLKFKLQFVSALVLVLFTSTTIYAYESDAVTNGHILYPLKRTTEKVEGMFANSPEEKSDYYHKMAKRRMRELDTLEKRGAFDEKTIAEAETMLTYAEEELANIPQPAASSDPMLEMAAPQVMMEGQPKNKREMKKEEILKTHEEFKKFKGKFEKKIEEKLDNQNNEPGKKDKKEILKNSREAESEIQNPEAETTPKEPKPTQQPIPQPVSGPYTKMPKIKYGETSIINLQPNETTPQIEPGYQPNINTPPPINPQQQPKYEKPRSEQDPMMIPTI